MTLWTTAYQAPLSMEFSRQEHWSGLSFPSPGDHPDLETEPGSPALQADSLPSEPPGKPETFSSVQSLGRVRLFATPWTTARKASLSITNSRSSLKPMSMESVMPSNHLILCHPLLLQPSIFPRIRVFSKESALFIRWPKYWSFSFTISPSNAHPGLNFRSVGLVGSPCSPRDYQESSPTPQFKSSNSSALRFLYSPTLTSIHDHWKNHSLD